METWNSRLANAMELRSKKVADIAKHLGLQHSAVRAWVSDKPDEQTADIKATNLLAVCEYLNADPYEIMTGKKRVGYEPIDDAKRSSVRGEIDNLLLNNIKMLVINNMLDGMPDKTKEFLCAFLGSNKLGVDLAKITLNMHKQEDFDCEKLAKFLSK